MPIPESVVHLGKSFNADFLSNLLMNFGIIAPRTIRYKLSPSLLYDHE
jgi:hypothetical protein